MASSKASMYGAVAAAAVAGVTAWLIVRKRSCSQKSASGEAKGAISKRGKAAQRPPVSYLADLLDAWADLYDADKNPNGRIILALAEQRSNFPMMAARIRAVAPAETTLASACYGPPHGLDRLRAAFASMMNYTCVKTPLDSNRICLSSGVAAVLNNLAMLLCDPGDVVLVPTPFYAAFVADLGAAAGAVIQPVPLAADDGYKLTLSHLDTAMRNSSGRVRAILLTNPNNPLGSVMSSKELQSVMGWCVDNDVHLISDEIYANCVYDSSSCSFTSAVDAVTDAAASGDIDGATLKRLVHVVWGLSKDFGLSGFRVGAMYSLNDDVMSGYHGVCHITMTSNHTGSIMAAVMEDAAFTKQYLHKCQQGLKSAKEAATTALTAAGIPFHGPAHAGFFIWIDLAKYAAIAAKGTSEDSPFAGERALHRMICQQARVVLTPGESFFSQVPGHFRLCFAWHNQAGVEEGLARLMKLLNGLTA